MAWIRPLLEARVSQRWLSTALFRNAARPRVIRSVLGQAYPSGANVDDQLVDLLYQPTQRPGAAEAFRGFINLFDDHLAPAAGTEASDLGGEGSLIDVAEALIGLSASACVESSRCFLWWDMA